VRKNRPKGEAIPAILTVFGEFAAIIPACDCAPFLPA
jgi:hypothetical protein